MWMKDGRNDPKGVDVTLGRIAVTYQYKSVFRGKIGQGHA